MTRSAKRGKAASEYDAFAPEGTVSRKSTDARESRQDPVRTGLVWYPAGGQVQQLAGAQPGHR